MTITPDWPAIKLSSLHPNHYPASKSRLTAIVKKIKLLILESTQKAGVSIKLKGKTLHTTCADGVSPCRFIGYLFKNGNVQYLIEEDGQLTVTRNKTEILVNEKGEWKN